MFMHHKRLIGILLMALTGLLAACDFGSGGGGGIIQSGKPSNAIDVSIIYAPESALYMPRVIQDFNQLSSSGKNPVTGQPYADGEQPVWVTDLTDGKGGSSGTVMQGIVNAIIAPNNQNVERPTIFQPSVSHWLALTNANTGREVFDLANIQPTANAAVVMAIW